VLDPFLRLAEQRFAGARTLGCYFGSFDPPHRGHVALARALLEETDAVLLLVPTWHFQKAFTFPAHASPSQRVEMFGHALSSPRLLAGTTETLLFLEIDARLQEFFPSTRVLFAMGDETYQRVGASQRYFVQAGRTWDGHCDTALQQLLSRCLVWNRSGAFGGGRVMSSVPPISSTQARAIAQWLWGSHASATAWHRALDPLVPPSVVDDIRSSGLYRIGP
jgi:cytidyltransferase-like protein